jgi:hypothetical protein
MDGTPTSIPPVEAFRFFAPASAEVKAEVEGKRRFSGVAYSGEVVTGHSYWNAVVFDLSTTKVADRTAVLVDHDRSQRAGVCKLSIADNRILAEGHLLPNTHGAAVAADADDGFPWEMSVHIQPGRVDELQAGSTTVVNGHTVNGPATIFRDSVIRELSFTPTGADIGTSAAVFSATKESTRMDPKIAELQSQLDAANAAKAAAEQALATATAERDQFKAAAETAQQTAAAAATAAREVEVKSLFTAIGREFSADAAKPYMALDADTFAAVAKDLQANTKRPDGLFTATATGPEGDAATATEAQKFAAGVAGLVNRPREK